MPERSNPNTHRLSTRWILAPAAVAEIAVFLAGLLALDELALSGARLWGVQPHPVWLVVVFTAVQYGTNAALLAALAGSGFLLSGELPKQTFDQNEFEYLFMLTKEPLLWLVVAVGAGELTLRHRREKHDAWERAERERQRADELSEAYATARGAVDRLEEHIASEVYSTASVLAMSARVDDRSPGLVLAGGVRAIQDLLKPTKFSIALMHAGDLQVAVQEGWEAGDGFDLSVTPDSPLYQAIVGEQRRVIVSARGDDAVLGANGVVAIPMFDPAAKRVIGMLKIEEIAFSELSFAAIELLVSMGDWIAAAWTQSDRNARARRHAMLSESLPLYSRSFLQKQRSVLTAIARRSGFPVTELRISRHGPHGNLSTHTLATLVADAVARVLRQTDLACTEAEPGDSFVILLPLTPAADATLVRDRLAAVIEENDRTAALAAANLEFEINVLVDPQTIEAAEASRPVHYG